MPIILPELPIAKNIAAEGIRVVQEQEYLKNKGIQIIPENIAQHQDIRPLKIVVLNLMPDKQGTEEQLARLLGHTPLQVHLSLLRTGSYQSKNESAEHLDTFYKTWDEISDQQFDGLIVTGAPIELLDWKDVQYWTELKHIFEWSKQNVYARLYICWGAQAALQHFFGVEKYSLQEKAFGIFPHTVRDWRHPLVEGYDDEFLIPVSRHTEIRTRDIEQLPELQILCESAKTGIHLIQHRNQRDTFMFNHPEYTANTLNREYVRDKEKNLPIAIPENYFPHNDPSQKPVNRWRAHGRIFYGNWLRQMYQNTPYDLRELLTMQDDAPIGDMMEV